MNKPDRAFVLRLSERLDSALQAGVIGIGWTKAKNLQEHKDWQSFKDVIRGAYPELYEGKERALGNAAGSVWQFIFEMQKGDYIVVPVRDGFYLAIVDSDIIYDEAGARNDFAWKRHVTWLTKDPKPRSCAVNQLQRRMKAQQTCVPAHDLVDVISETKDRKTPITFNGFVLENAYETVAKALRSAINDVGLEELVRKLAQASGAVAVVMPKNTKLPGDVDVTAIYDLKVGYQEIPVKVLYQIKQHEGVSDEHGIKQLIERMETMPDAYKACFVTTAKTINERAQKLADDSCIIVLTEKDLVEWILMTGLDALQDKD